MSLPGVRAGASPPSPPMATSISCSMLEGDSGSDEAASLVADASVAM
jgi:hypothetical protein